MTLSKILTLGREANKFFRSAEIQSPSSEVIANGGVAQPGWLGTPIFIAEIIANEGPIITRNLEF